MGIETQPDLSWAEQGIVVVIGLPGRVISSIAEVMQLAGLPMSEAAKATILFFLCIFAIYITSKHCRGWFCKPLSAYFLLILIALLFEFARTVYSFAFPTQYQISGDMSLFQISQIDNPIGVRGQFSSNDCSAHITREVNICTTSGREIKPPFRLDVTSANCGSAVENIRSDPNKPDCLIVRERLTGCGYTNVLGIRSCNGRGWLDYQIFGVESSMVKTLTETKKLSGTFSKETRFSFAGQLSGSGATAIKFNIKISGPDSYSAVLTDENPSDSRFRVDVEKGGILIQKARTTID